MISLTSGLENKEQEFRSLNDYLAAYEFTLGGNWEYDHGYFDRNLDEAQKVWLRIPFQVTHGTMEGDSSDSDAVIRLGQPFVLKHIYNEGADREAQMRVAGSLVDQFQTPLDKDAPVERIWIDAAKRVLGEVENGLVH
ncbi:MAG: hypothetical protein J7639_06385 [Paenibacillaceae bacterium]|nr:hypothetical protein [Paenibacillaceae bacterium]